ncbi:MAG: hypothetical protein JOZ17_22400, partial [Acetobacteraceae bacterium]|nr:hypothetical protein [Acetobacteraceae bacterium]
MLRARVEIRGEDLFCSDTQSGGLSSRTALSEETLSALREWASRYDKAVRSGDPDPLAAIGNEIAALLNQGDRWLDRVLDGTGEIDFEIAVPARPDDRERVLLDVPWEVLATDSLFLAADEQRLFRVSRRLGNAAEPAAPAFRDVALLFMAAEVEGQSVLNHEHEESAILDATKS